MNTYRFFRVLPIALLLIIAPVTAYAAHAEFGKSVSIPTTQIVADNEYLAGGQVVFSSTAQKDLVVAGGQVTVNGPVWGDIVAAGGMVQILREVRGDVRAAGGQVTIAQSITGDVLAAGGSLTILPGAVIGGDVVALGGTIDVEGTVNGSLRAYGGNVTVNGVVAGPASIKAGKSVTFGGKALMGNVVVYSAPSEATVAPGAKIGDKVTFTKLGGLPKELSAAGVLFGLLGFLLFVKFVAILVTALVATQVFQGFALSLSRETLGRFWKSAGIGFIALIVAPVLIVLLAFSVIGVYAAFMLGALYIFVLVLAGIYVCILTGALLSRWAEKEVKIGWKWTTLGTIAVFGVWFVPFVGWIVLFILYCAAVGALAMSLVNDTKAKIDFH